jgi:hypothetical protein
MTVRPLFAWYDLWIGAYWDRAGRKLYVLPLPCLGFVISFGPRKPTWKERLFARPYCDHQGIGMPDCPVCDPRAYK